MQAESDGDWIDGLPGGWGLSGWLLLLVETVLWVTILIATVLCFLFCSLFAQVGERGFFIKTKKGESWRPKDQLLKSDTQPLKGYNK